MAHLINIATRVDKGESVYVIDEYDERALFFCPELGQNVLSKRKGSNNKYKRPLTDALIIESVFNGKEVTKIEYENY